MQPKEMKNEKNIFISDITDAWRMLLCRSGRRGILYATCRNTNILYDRQHGNIYGSAAGGRLL